MPSSKDIYLAQHYLNGPKADAILEKTNVKKKKKSTKKSTQIGSIKINEDDDLLNKPFNKDDDDNDNAVTVISNETKFKSISKPSNNDDDIANKDDNLDNDPVVVNDEPQIEEFKGGLKSAKQIRKENAERRQKEEAQRQVELEKMSKEQQNQNDTVYRDSTGRKIDIKAEEIERKRKKMEEDEKEAQKMEWGKGLVQREDRQRKQKEIDDMKNKPMARYHDDAEINAELMDVERWNDPAAAFMTKKESKGPKKPKYTGPPPPPNRFGIQPGYRWDGVDRSNGFEQKLFQTINSKNRAIYEHGQWSREDM